MSLTLGAPQALAPSHLLGESACGEITLDQWLQRRALANQATGASRTFVVADSAGRVFGYYAMAAGAVSRQEATGNDKRNMPDPIPVMILARLAVDRRAQGIRLGGALLQDALRRTLAIAQNTGVRALLVHALNEPARQFYQHYGFQESPLNPMTLMLRLRGFAVAATDRFDDAAAIADDPVSGRGQRAATFASRPRPSRRSRGHRRPTAMHGAGGVGCSRP